MIIAIDFDGTIVEHKYPEVGKIIEGADVVIGKLKKAGHTIIIWTCRGGFCLLKAKYFLDANKIPYDYLNENAPLEEIGLKPFPKVFANIYIDDRNFGGFPGWDVIGKALL